MSIYSTEIYIRKLFCALYPVCNQTNKQEIENISWHSASMAEESVSAAIYVCYFTTSYCQFFSQSWRCHRHCRQAVSLAGSANCDGYQY